MKSNYTPHDGDRVRLATFDGPLGRVIRCRNHQTKEIYFKVKPDAGGPWWGTERLVADSEGLHQRTCTDCEIPFRSNDAFAPLCPNCEHRQAERDRRRTGEPHSIAAAEPMHRKPHRLRGLDDAATTAETERRS